MWRGEGGKREAEGGDATEPLQSLLSISSRVRVSPISWAQMLETFLSPPRGAPRLALLPHSTRPSFPPQRARSRVGETLTDLPSLGNDTFNNRI